MSAYATGHVTTPPTKRAHSRMNLVFWMSMERTDSLIFGIEKDANLAA